ncbi:choice-of-anchor D domain-containing protein [Wenzhouxiangella sp. XN79A]|uniref:choice-of-anchor D domain-containing protein n=1 Tax=Wenzhouxiangella sp. XN79A TaxID=2724193 RepID=UPI00144A9059|nr:choice-of-anchor D domain-containing protein [Wenzhouxiangella sp. XN79A]NKI36207.1 choice-of-anchor D domain-containing protein [Wenzhouxiangella sp. XN79A]
MPHRFIHDSGCRVRRSWSALLALGVWTVAATMAATAVPAPAAAQDFPPAIDLGSLDGSNGWFADGESPSDTFARSMAGIGDINADGFDDLVIGADGFDLPGRGNTGRSYVVFGRADGFPAQIDPASLDGSDGFVLNGERSDNASGWSVAGAGDINADGIDDLLIGAYFANSVNGPRSGRSYVVYGRSSGFPATLELSSLDGTHGFSIDGADTDDWTGFSVAGAGDVNGDGIDDIILGSLNAEPTGLWTGAAYLVFGRSAPFPARLDLATLDGSEGSVLAGVSEGEIAGRSVSAAGDVNGDGIDDVVIGAPWAAPSGAESGRGYVVFGRTTGFPALLDLGSLNGSDGFSIDGEASPDRLGWAVAGAGDVNGDGLDDLLLGAPLASPNGTESGRSYLLFGRSTGFPATLDLSTMDATEGIRIDGETPFDQSGLSVARAGDLDADGIDDVAVGAGNADGNAVNAGRAYVIFGRTEGFISPLQLSALDGRSGFRLNGEANFDSVGDSVAAAGDLDGDGVDDLAVGAPFASYNSTSSGRGFVVYGRVTGTPALDFGGTEFLDFGDVFLGTDAAPRTVTLGNPGSGMVSIDVIAVGDPAFSIAGGSCGSLPIRIPVGDACTLEIGFAPEAVGLAQAQLTLEGTSTTSPDSIFVQGRGVPMPEAELRPDPLRFGDVAEGDLAIEMLLVESTGAGALAPGAATIDGLHAAEFTIMSNDCTGAVLDPGETCGIDIGFSPTAPGIRGAILTLASNAPAGPHVARLGGSSGVLFADDFETP